MIWVFTLAWLPHLVTNPAVSLRKSACDELLSLSETRWALHFKDFPLQTLVPESDTTHPHPATS